MPFSVINSYGRTNHKQGRRVNLVTVSSMTSGTPVAVNKKSVPSPLSPVSQQRSSQEFCLWKSELICDQRSYEESVNMKTILLAIACATCISLTAANGRGMYMGGAYGTRRHAWGVYSLVGTCINGSNISKRG